MIGRALWFASLLCLVFIVMGVQLDRQSRKNPALAPHVPEIFRSSALLPLAAAAIEAGDGDRGLTEARTLVQNRPLPAEHLRLLAQAQFAAGDIEASALTIQYAAQRGWRDALPQEAMLQLALSNDDPPEAARRYAALFLMRDTEDAMLEELGRTVLAQPGGDGRTTLAGIVGGGDRWHNLFLTRGARVMPPQAFSQVLRLTLEDGTSYDCRRLRQAQRYVSSRDVAAGTEIKEIVDREC